MLHPKENNQILLFFTDDYTHIIIQEAVNSVPRQLLRFVRRMPIVEDDYIFFVCVLPCYRLQNCSLFYTVLKNRDVLATVPDSVVAF